VSFYFFAQADKIFCLMDTCVFLYFRAFNFLCVFWG